MSYNNTNSRKQWKIKIQEIKHKEVKTSSATRLSWTTTRTGIKTTTTTTITVITSTKPSRTTEITTTKSTITIG